MQELADQYSVQISLDPQAGDSQQDEGQPCQQSGHIDQEQTPGHAQSLQDAGQGSVQIEEGADQAQGADEMPGKGAFVQALSQKSSGEQEKALRWLQMKSAALLPRLLLP